MFSLACNLLKMNAYSNDFEKILLAKNPCDCSQMRSNHIAANVNAPNHFIFNKLKRYQKSDIKDIGQRYQLVRCYEISKTTVSFRYQLKRLCDVLRWSVSLRCQLVHRYDVSNWSQFLLGTKAVHFSGTSGGSASLNYQLVCRYSISKTSVSFRY